MSRMPIMAQGSREEARDYLYQIPFPPKEEDFAEESARVRVRVAPKRQKSQRTSSSHRMLRILTLRLPFANTSQR